MRMRPSPNVVMSFFIGVGVVIILGFVAAQLQSNILAGSLLFPGIPASSLVLFVQTHLCEQSILTGKACTDDLMWGSLAISSWVFWGLLFAFIAWQIEKYQAKQL